MNPEDVKLIKDLGALVVLLVYCHRHIVPLLRSIVSALEGMRAETRAISAAEVRALGTPAQVATFMDTMNRLPPLGPFVPPIDAPGAL